MVERTTKNMVLGSRDSSMRDVNKGCHAWNNPTEGLLWHMADHSDEDLGSNVSQQRAWSHAAHGLHGQVVSSS